MSVDTAQSIDLVREHAISAALNKVTLAAAGGTVFLGMTASDVAMLGGLAVAVLSMAINAGMNWYFKAQHLQLEQERIRLGLPGNGDGE